MKYRIEITDPIAKDVYNTGSFDLEYSGADRALDRILRFLEKHASDSALEMCSDISLNSFNDTRNSFDRGYVNGVMSTIKFLQDARTMGKNLMYGRAEVEGPSGF